LLNNWFAFRVRPERIFPAGIQTEQEWHFIFHTGILTVFNWNLENICPFLTFMFKIHIRLK
jgi:hypothetical protein